MIERIEISDVHDVMPFDVLDEGSVVAEIRFPSGSADVGQLYGEEIDVGLELPLIAPRWENMRVIQLVAPLTVLRGIAPPIRRLKKASDCNDR